MAKIILMLILLMLPSCSVKKELHTQVDAQNSIEVIHQDSVSVVDWLTKYVKTDGVTTEDHSEDVKIVATIVTEDIDTVGRVVRRQTASVEVVSAANTTRRDSLVIRDTTTSSLTVSIVTVDSVAANTAIVADIEENISKKPDFGSVGIVVLAILVLVYVFKRLFLF